MNGRSSQVLTAARFRALLSEAKQLQLQEISNAVGDTPFMSLSQAQRIERLADEYELSQFLELGFFHGVSTCDLAALARRRQGHVTALDRERVRDLSPSATDLLARTGLEESATLFHEPTSYTWRLMRMLEESHEPRFDLCYIDGAHNWFVDGFAFFLVDKLLKPGGWIVFDDLNWTYGSSARLVGTDMVREMPDDERTTRQVERIYELLVKPHPSYGNFRIEEGWAFARKLRAEDAQRDVRTEVIVEWGRVSHGIKRSVRFIGNLVARNSR